MLRSDGYNLDDVKCRRGIILAGGTGSRLYPMTSAVNKHLLPVFDKPMIYYPLTTLMFAGVREFLVISSETAIAEFTRVLHDGSQWGISISYAIQTAPRGIAEALLIGEKFIAGEPFALILGDNIFYGHGLPQILTDAATKAAGGASVLTYPVSDPQRYGIVRLDRDGRPIEIAEKPANPRSNHAVTGLYFYAPDAVEIARTLKSSARGELEITDVNATFLRQSRLHVEQLGRGSVWFDAGTSESLFQAGAYIEIVQKRQAMGIAFPEEVSLRLGHITFDQFEALVHQLPRCGYREYLTGIVSTFGEMHP